ncbi:MAG: helix-turn-helix transcriptional regulator [Ruminococcaceae bacterium]|nr:helix-turn-helix transcriptional regulator [Oscillospiraceae bacterium]
MIAEIRKRNNYSQSALAKELCVSQQTVSHWENGVRTPSIDKLIIMSDLFGCTIDELVRGEKQ